MTLGEAFTKRLNDLLVERNISLHKFVKENCIARSTIVNIQKGYTKSPTLAIIFQVADGFGMTAIEFLDHPYFKQDELDYL